MLKSTHQEEQHFKSINQHQSQSSSQSDDDQVGVPVPIVSSSMKMSASQSKWSPSVIIMIVILIVAAISFSMSYSGSSKQKQIIGDETNLRNSQNHQYQQNRQQSHAAKTQQSPNLIETIQSPNQNEQISKPQSQTSQPSHLRANDYKLFQIFPVYWNTPQQSNYSQFYDESGQLITLKYRKPQIIIPQKIDQNQCGDIGPINIQQANQFIQQSNDHASMIYSFVRHRSKKVAQQAQYLYYSRLYNIDKYHQQLPICVLSPYRNFYNHADGQRYLASLQDQNYTNYQVIMIDDMSKDDSVKKLLINLKQFPRVNNRITLMKNLDHTGALGNRDLATRKLCKNDSILVQLDADDYIIGRQVFNIYNTKYQQNPNLWFMYSNYVHLKNRVPTLGKNGPIKDQIFQTNSYRTTQKFWVTIHLRSYLKQLYMKIPPNYLLQQPDKYYLWASDRFNMYALTQLAGRKHMQYLPEQFYYYNFPDDGKRPNCEIIYIRQTDYLCRQQTPLQPLQSLQDQVKYKQNHQIPQFIRQQYQQFSTKLEACMKKFGLSKDTITK